MDAVVALHGFAGTGRSWDALGIEVRAPDLPGHGSAGAVRPITFASCVEHVLEHAPERFVLAGYSMGGRVALHVALAAPQRIARLVLISTTAGIDDDAERRERCESDERLAAELEVEPIEAFAARWMALPLFDRTPADAAAFWRADILRNEPSGLAASLRGVGTGAMEPLWPRLDSLTMPASVVAGERDARYVALGERLATALPGAAPLVIVPGVGHGVVREAAETVTGLLVAR